MLYICIQDEYRVYNTCLGALIDYPGRSLFAQVAQAGPERIAAVSRLFTSRGLDVPGSLFSVANVPRYATFSVACQAGALAATTSYLMYEGFLADLKEAGPVPADVQDAFTSLMTGSRDVLLPAFLAAVR